VTVAHQPISFEEFQRLIAQELQVDESQVVPEASFVQDLFADSIRLVELLLHLEEAGIDIPIEKAWNVETVGDAYQLYSSQIDRNSPPPTETKYSSENCHICQDTGRSEKDERKPIV
jgi:acyl carrier protein